jgi:putative effector of murein hydrolase LrgA (UPF0299 family)
MNKAVYIFLHLLLLLAVFTAPAIIYDSMYKLEENDLLYTGVPIPFIYAGFWILKIKNKRAKIILLNLLILFFIPALVFITEPSFNKYNNKALLEILFPLVLVINLLILVAAAITQYLNKDKYLGKTYIWSTIIVLILSLGIFFLWVLGSALGAMRGAITG